MQEGHTGSKISFVVATKQRNSRVLSKKLLDQTINEDWLQFLQPIFIYDTLPPY